MLLKYRCCWCIFVTSLEYVLAFFNCNVNVNFIKSYGSFVNLRATVVIVGYNIICILIAVKVRVCTCSLLILSVTLYETVQGIEYDVKYFLENNLRL